MAKSPRTGQPRGRKAAERRPVAQEAVTPEAPPSTADDYKRVAAAVEATRHGGATREEIARRAYELYVARGGTHGYDIEDWLQAERELRRK
jgi:Protein of unknown function (DUF2934)